MADPIETPKADDLADLVNQAKALETAAGAGGPNDPNAPGAENLPAVPPKQTNAQIIGGMLAMIRETFSAATGYETPRLVLTDSAVEQLAGLWGAVCDKRKIDLGAMQGEHWDLILAVVATVPLAIALRNGMAAEMAQRARTVENQPRPPQDGLPVGQGNEPTNPNPAGGVTDAGGAELAAIGAVS